MCDPRRIKYEGDVVAELGRLPQTLAESYDITYETINNSGEASRAVAERTLKWLMCAQRPLKLRELYAAVSVDLDGRYPLPSTEDLLDSCCNLMVIDSELQVFRFAHSSVRDYLESRAEYNVCETHALALTRCLDLLTVPTSTSISTHSKTVWNDNFRQYAIAYWPMHYRTVEHKQPKGSDFEKVLLKARQFLFGNHDAAFVQWISAAKALSQTLHWDDPLKETLNAIFSTPPTPLFLACSFGLLSMMDELGGCEHVDWNQRNVMGNTGLHHAAANGHEKVVEMLLDRGADLEVKTTRTRTALHKAAEHGHRAVVGVLLQRGANIAAQDDRGATALHEASAHGHEAVVVLLLEEGAGCTTTDNRGGTALHVAARHGHACVIQRLINYGVDFMARDASQWTSLHSASGRGHEAVVRLLLENGADTAARDAHGGTALHWASGLGHEPVVRLLLKHGAGISAKDENGDTALHVSAGRGHEPVVRLLLENGADVESKTIYGGTPLQRAVSKNRHTVAEVLRQYCEERGITIAEESMGVSPALLAAHSDHFFCDNCDGTIPHSNVYYHCNICDDGDFDLCSDCFDKGVLCYEDGHRLSKLSRGETFAPSDVKADHAEPEIGSEGR
jgi:ankyrin repeat protein